jgi:hypothetical protein
MGVAHGCERKLIHHLFGADVDVSSGLMSVSLSFETLNAISNIISV